jgi:hypothetical protein
LSRVAILGVGVSEKCATVTKQAAEPTGGDRIAFADEDLAGRRRKVS